MIKNQQASGEECSLCGRKNPIQYKSAEIGIVCVACEETDRDLWASAKIAKERSGSRKRSAMYNISEKLGILGRVKFPNEGTCLLDDRVYYYAQKQRARVKGGDKYYQMRGFQHFLDVFGKR